MFRHQGLVPLSRDHHHALALCVRTERVLRADAADAAVAQAASAIVEKFDREILDHFEFEERVLFPALAGFEALQPVVTELKGEHSLMLELVARLRIGGQRCDVDRFVTLLREHVHKEERVLFERSQDLLAEEQLNEIGVEREAVRAAAPR